MEENSRFSYKPSFLVLMGVAILMFLLIHCDLPLLGYVLAFNLAFWLLVADSSVQQFKENEKLERQ